MIVNKQCEACHAFFDTKNKIKKYCDSCGKNGQRIKQQIEKNIYKSKRSFYQPETFENNCAECNKIFNTSIKKPKDFCSNECHHSYSLKQKQINNPCLFCKTHVDNPEQTYCNEICKKQHNEKIRWNRERYNGNVVKCKQCQVEFIERGYNQFCSSQCNKIWEKNNVQIFSKSCQICNKLFQYKKNDIRFTCSNECRIKRNNLIKQKQTQKSLTQKEINDNTKKSHLCIQCKTPQSKCDFFISNYTYHPKGTKIKYIDNMNVVIECPKYTK